MTASRKVGLPPLVRHSAPVTTPLVPEVTSTVSPENDVIATPKSITLNSFINNAISKMVIPPIDVNSGKNLSVASLENTEMGEGGQDLGISEFVSPRKVLSAPKPNSNHAWRDKVANRLDKGVELYFVESPSDNNEVNIDLDDIQEELDYWKYTLVGNVLEAKPSLDQITAFVDKYWNCQQA